MQLTLELFLAKCDIDYDSIIFIKDCFTYNYDYLINNFDISRFIVHGFYVDQLNCFTVIIDDKYIDYN